LRVARFRRPPPRSSQRALCDHSNAGFRLRADGPSRSRVSRTENADGLDVSKTFSFRAIVVCGDVQRDGPNERGRGAAGDSVGFRAWGIRNSPTGARFRPRVSCLREGKISGSSPAPSRSSRSTRTRSSSSASTITISRRFALKPGAAKVSYEPFSIPPPAETPKALPRNAHGFLRSSRRTPGNPRSSTSAPRISISWRLSTRIGPRDQLRHVHGDRGAAAPLAEVAQFVHRELRLVDHRADGAHQPADSSAPPQVGRLHAQDAGDSAAR
jgi:hypothetical protein